MEKNKQRKNDPHTPNHILSCVTGVNGEGGESIEGTRSLSFPVPPSSIHAVLPYPSAPFCSCYVGGHITTDFDDQSSLQVFSNI